MQTTNLTQTRHSTGRITHATLMALVLIASLFLSACASTDTKDPTKSVRDSRLTPAQAAQRLFERGEKMMNSGNYEVAMLSFEQLETQYPLSKYTRQAQLNLIYTHYKRNNKELAVDAANQFIKENPVHKKLDYVYYILGLVHFDKQNHALENLFNIDRSKRPQNDMQDSMEYFETLISKYPDSEYVPDAKQRIVFIRERLAAHELRIAQYYARRQIYIAAANRAKIVVQKYPDTRAARGALSVLETSYTSLGMTDMAADIRRIRQQNPSAPSL